MAHQRRIMERPMMRQLTRRGAVCALASLLGTAPLLASHSFAQEAELAIRGYDPVAYFTDGRPVPGLPEIEYEWDEHRYRFANAEHRELFKGDPVRYAPQFANYCAMALSMGEVVVADPENWLISDGKLYVFGKVMGPDLFRRDLAGNISKANQNRPILEKH